MFSFGHCPKRGGEGLARIFLPFFPPCCPLYFDMNIMLYDTFWSFLTPKSSKVPKLWSQLSLVQHKLIDYSVLLVRMISWSWWGLIQKCQWLKLCVQRLDAGVGPTVGAAPVWAHLPWWQQQKHRFHIWQENDFYLQIIIVCWYCNFQEQVQNIL